MSAHIIKLTNEEALAFFEYLSRSTDSENSSIEQKSELSVIESILCYSEETLAEPFEADYHDKLQAAQNKLTK